mmetsp:Transcript_42798/g.93261  ORF Transcript_42798/g.93261 Transcript_42798/m.93261 type:complete len:97 (+) Transcript_42798:457-747(+)
MRRVCKKYRRSASSSILKKLVRSRAPKVAGDLNGDALAGGDRRGIVLNGEEALGEGALWSLGNSAADEAGEVLGMRGMLQGVLVTFWMALKRSFSH